MKCLYIVCYDVSSNKARAKIEKIISGYGQRVQYSIFECILDVENKNELLGKLKKIFATILIDEKTDSIRIYRICESCRQKIYRMGLDRSPNEKYIIV